MMCQWSLLGHNKMQTTQDSYDKIVEKKISLEMESLKKQACFKPKYLNFIWLMIVDNRFIL